MGHAPPRRRPPRYEPEYPPSLLPALGRAAEAPIAFLLRYPIAAWRLLGLVLALALLVAGIATANPALIAAATFLSAGAALNLAVALTRREKRVDALDAALERVALKYAAEDWPDWLAYEREVEELLDRARSSTSGRVRVEARLGASNHSYGIRQHVPRRTPLLATCVCGHAEARHSETACQIAGCACTEYTALLVIEGGGYIVRHQCPVCAGRWGRVVEKNYSGANVDRYLTCSACSGRGSLFPAPDMDDQLR